MRTHSLKPFDDGKYLSEEEALKMLESIPIPKDDSEKDKSIKVEPGNSLHNRNSNLENKITQLDSLPADNGSQKTQEEWITYWNNINDGRIFASMPDYYQAFKQLKEKFEHSSAQEKDFTKKIIVNLKKDLRMGWVVTSTRIKYKDNPLAIITHHYGSKLVQPVEYKVFIPEYHPRLLTDVLDTNEGLRYLQALFGTKDYAFQIEQTLQIVNNFSLDQTLVWTPLGWRKDYSESVSSFESFNRKFNILSGSDFDDHGRSRGVCLNPAPKNGGSP